jgi:hypothetical protein
MHTAAIAESGYWNLTLSMLDESSTNPRRTHPHGFLAEMLLSFLICG